MEEILCIPSTDNSCTRHSRISYRRLLHKLVKESKDVVFLSLETPPSSAFQIVASMLEEPSSILVNKLMIYIASINV